MSNPVSAAAVSLIVVSAATLSAAVLHAATPPIAKAPSGASATATAAAGVSSSSAPASAPSEATVSTAPQEPDQSPPWKGSSVSVGHYATALTFVKSAEPDWNPTVYQVLNVDPRYKLNDRISLSGHAELATELTDSDTTTRKREPLLGDIWGKGSYALTLPSGFKGAVGLRLSLPTSKESIARRRIAVLKSSFDVQRPFTFGKDVKLAARGGLAATYTPALARQIQYDAPAILGCQPGSGDNTCAEFDHGGNRSTLAGFEQSLGADLSLPHRLTISARLLWIQSLLYPLDEITNPVTGEPVPEAGTNTDWRLVNAYVLGVDWAITDHWSLGGGFQTLNPQLAPDSSYYRPFFNRYTEVFLTAGYAL